MTDKYVIEDGPQLRRVRHYIGGILVSDNTFSLHNITLGVN